MRAQLRSILPVAGVISIVACVSASVAFVGADARWLEALGHTIVTRRAIPAGLSFAGAPTTHWPNPLVLAELIFYVIGRSVGDRGLMVAQLVAAAAAMGILARDALRGGASPIGTSLALTCAALGSLPSLAIVRVQVFSLVLFPVLVSLLRSEVRAPSGRIWLVVPLLALWSNLHGAVLVGLAVALVYLLFVRLPRQPITTAAVSVTMTVALFFTPAGLRTPAYYEGLLTSHAVAGGQGLWAPLSLASPLDLLLIIVAIGLAVGFLRAGPPAWELLTSVLLAGLTINASRSGVWLLFFLVVPAAKSFRPREVWAHVLPGLGALSAIVLAFAVVRGPLTSGASPALITRAIELARGTPVLAQDAVAEQVALAGGLVWLADPIDAFRTQDQQTYLDWLGGRASGVGALGDVNVVLVTGGSAAGQLMSRVPEFTVIGYGRGVRLYVRNADLAQHSPRLPALATPVFGVSATEKNL